jgi:hypothetical protein
MTAPGVREERGVLLRYKVNGSAEMTVTSLVRARGVVGRRGASPSLSMVGRSSATVVSGESRIPFKRSSRDRRLAWRCRSSTMVRYGMATRKREDEVFPNAAGIDIGASSHWVAVPRHLAEAADCDPVREVGAMTADLEALATWLLRLGVDTVAVETTGVYWIPVFEVLEQHGLKVWLVDARQLNVRTQCMQQHQEQPEDFVIAAEVQNSVRPLMQWSPKELGITLRFQGQGVDQVALIDSIEGDKAPGPKPGQIVVRVDPRYFRPTDVETLLGDPPNAKVQLGWTPEITVQQMCAEMVATDLQADKQHALLKASGFVVSVSVIVSVRIG